MRALIVVWTAVFISILVVIPAKCQENSSASQAANDNASSQAANDSAVEGEVVSSTRNTLVVRTGDNQYQLFTYDRSAVRAALVQGARVRVTAGPADENGTRVASNITVVITTSGGGGAPDKGAQAAPVPQKVRDIESDI